MTLDSTSESIYQFIERYIERENISPSQREIAEGCHLNAATVVRYLDKLEAWERIRRDPTRARSIVILKRDQG